MPSLEDFRVALATSTHKVQFPDMGAYKPIQPLRALPTIKWALDPYQHRRGAPARFIHSRLQTSAEPQFVRGATGSGKSTKLPVDLAIEHSYIVLLVQPNELLSQVNHGIVTKLASIQDPSIRTQHIDHQAPFEPGVSIYTLSVQTLVARAIAGTMSVPDGDRSRVLLYLDEVHDVVAASYAARRLLRVFNFCHHIVGASATFSGQLIEPRELNVVQTVAIREARAWQSMGEHDPLGIHLLRRNTLVFCHDESVKQSYMRQLSELRVRLVEVNSKTTAVEIERLAQELEDLDRAGDFAVVFSDATLRTGFDLRFYSVVDSGMKIVAGQEVPLNAALIEQAKGRAVRFPTDQTGYYFRPSLHYPNSAVELMGCDVDCATALIKLAGYQPPRELQHSIFFDLQPSADWFKAFPGVRLAKAVRTDVRSERADTMQKQRLGWADIQAAFSIGQPTIPQVGYKLLFYTPEHTDQIPHSVIMFRQYPDILVRYVQENRAFTPAERVACTALAIQKFNDDSRDYLSMLEVVSRLKAGVRITSEGRERAMKSLFKAERGSNLWSEVIVGLGLSSDTEQVEFEADYIDDIVNLFVHRYAPIESYIPPHRRPRHLPASRSIQAAQVGPLAIMPDESSRFVELDENLPVVTAPEVRAADFWPNGIFQKIITFQQRPLGTKETLFGHLSVNGRDVVFDPKSRIYSVYATWRDESGALLQREN